MRDGDYRIAAIAGFFTGVFMLPVLYNLAIAFPFGLPYVSIVFIIPVFWVIGIWLGKVLSRWLGIMPQFSRYAAAGFLSFAIDFGITNTLIFFTGIASGRWFAVFKAAGYVVANVNAYIWNKYWVFRQYTPDERVSLRTVAREYGKFLTVSVIGFVINVSVASLVVDVIRPQFGFAEKAWANIALIIATAITIIWNFAGYKLFVFRKSVNQQNNNGNDESTGIDNEIQKSIFKNQNYNSKF